MSANRNVVLVVDDEEMIRRACARTLADAYTVLEAGTLQDAERILDEGHVDLCLSDVRLPDGDGVERLASMRRRSPKTVFLFMTGHGGVDAAVQAVKGGAWDFLTKPFDSLEKISISVAKALEHKEVRDQADRLMRDADRRNGFDAVIGSSPLMARAIAVAKDVAYSTSSVLLRGESGTGKEVFARAIHQSSPRARGPFVVVNCGALPEALIESELFGHVRGSFTGAMKDKRGLFEEAHGGTIFLDEIGEMPVAAQVRLLRVLQSGEIRRVGATDAKNVDVRVIAATNADLKAAIKDGRFREDLFYRLHVIGIELPALRARRDDVPLLANRFLHASAKKMGKPVKTFTDAAMRALISWTWPGNVRELENAIERAVVLVRDGEVDVQHLPEAIFPAVRAVPPGGGAGGADSESTPSAYKEARERSIDEFERSYVAALLRMTQGNMASAASIAGLDRSNFRKVVVRSGVDYREYLPARTPGTSSTAA